MKQTKKASLFTLPYFLCIIWILTNSVKSIAQDCSRTDSIKHYKLIGHVISSQSAPNIWSCFQVCKGRIDCQSINYEVETSICEINNRAKNGKLYRFVSKMGSVYMENPFRARLGLVKDLPGLSCKEIKYSYDNLTSGEYWINPNNTKDPFTVFCDMETVEGGWTLIAQTVVTDPTSFSPMIRAKDFTMIQNYSNGLVRIDIPAIRQLKQLINFTQIRYFCHKKSTGRTFHIMTKNDPHGKRAVKYLIEDPSVQPRACGSFVAFPDDNSFLATNCAKWGNDGSSGECNKWGYFKHKGIFRIYNDPILWEGKHYVNLKTSVLACDDLITAPLPLSKGDKWQLFVR